MLRVNQLTGFGVRRRVVPFTDDFNDNSISTAKWTPTNSTDITISETSQQLHFVSDASYSGSGNGASLVSVPIFNHTGQSTYVHFVSNTVDGGPGLGVGTNGSGGSSFMIRDTANGGNSARIVVDGNSIIFRRSNAGVHSQSVITFTSDYRWWKIEHVSADNTWKFYTSFTGASWTLRCTSAAANWNPTAVVIDLGAYIYGPNSVGRSTDFDTLVSTATW